ncbi:hypothetical protein NGH54_12585 [Staphylococcus xylosus]|uniref:hypothetical protein n=1 Tax=Staphylococcus xylosus TaxID=1288 RepID=UPI002DB68AA2|nr:hypothetical protein [Staphylococcus xylosus]MEB8071553.1 hypothetical protein [Staphylococcus xylosus]
METKQLLDSLNLEIKKVQENIDSRGDLISSLIKDGLNEIKIRDNLIKLKEQIEKDKPTI